jgi:hypothetical protein
MRDPKEIRKRINYAERRMTERQVEADAILRKGKRARRLGLQDGRPLCGAPTRNSAVALSGSWCRRLLRRGLSSRRRRHSAQLLALDARMR